MSERSDKCQILAVAQDPGGAAALSPVLEALSGRNEVSCQVLTCAHGMRVFAESGVPFVSLDEMIRPGEDWQAGARRILQEAACNLVITGTSFGPSPERAFIRAARMMGIKSFTLLDSWTNYRLRFLEPGESDLSTEILPDVIGIMNEFAKTEMEAAGFPSQMLHVVGQPAMDAFLARARSGKRAERNALRTRWNVPMDEPILSFFSQPIEALYGPVGSQTFRGYTEWDALDTVAETIVELPGRPTFLVKPHPKESLVHYADRIRTGASWTLADDDEESLLLGSDVIIGMTSLALVKAFVLARPVISVQPNLRGEDQCLLARAGYIKTVTQRGEFKDALTRALAWNDQTRSEGLLDSLGDGQAVARITALIQRLLDRST